MTLLFYNYFICDIEQITKELYFEDCRTSWDITNFISHISIKILSIQSAYLTWWLVDNEFSVDVLQ